MKRPKNNRIILILSVFLIFLVMGAVSANTNDIHNNDSVSQNDILTSTDDVNEVDTISTDTNEKLSTNAENNTFGEGETQKTFKDLNNEINGNNKASITLSGDYTFNKDTDSPYELGIVITRNITIDGQGQAIIDGNNLARIFYVADEVTSFTLKNIQIQNANANGNGGVVYFNENMQHVEISSTFINNTADSAGVFYFAQGVSGDIIFDGIYENNYARSGHGVMNLVHAYTGANVNLKGKFKKNSCVSEVGVVYVGYIDKGATVTLSGEFSDNTNGGNPYGAAPVVYANNINGNLILSGIFNNNTAKTTGGILYINSIVYGNVTLSGKFTNNNASSGDGGIAVFANGVYGNVYLTGEFKNNDAGNGGIVKFTDIYGNVVLDGTFENNHARTHGGVVNFAGTTQPGANITIKGTYNNNSAEQSVGVIWFNGATKEDANILIDGTFTNNIAKANGGAIYFNGEMNGNAVIKGTYTDNSATNGGGAIFLNTLGSDGQVIINGTFTNNGAGAKGGVLHANTINGNLIIDGTFTNNDAGGDGAFGSLNTVNGNVTVSGTFKGNNATNTLIKVGNIDSYDNIKLEDVKSDNPVTIMSVASSINAVMPTTVSKNKKVFIEIQLNGISNCSGVSVDLNIPGKSKITIALNDAGYANYTISDLTPGEYNITVTYAGNDTYIGSSVSKIVTVLNKDAKTFTDLYNELNPSIPTSTITLNGLYVYDPETDSEYKDGITLLHDINIIGNGAIIDGNKLARILNINYITTIKGVTFQNAYGSGDAGAISWYADGGSLINCKFINNTASNEGGAMLYNSRNSNIINCTFTGNVAQGNVGGAIYITKYSSNVTIDGSRFTNNTANTGGALGIWTDSNNIRIINSNFTYNTARSVGGAIQFNSNCHDNIVSNCIFINNTAASQGGAIYTYSSHTTINGTFINNTAPTNQGGAIFVMAPTNVTIDGTYNNNYAATSGGAIYVSDALTDSIITGNYYNNRAGGQGGAILLSHASNNNLNITDAEFINNSAVNYGGAIFTRGNINVEDSTFINNTANQGAAVFTNNGGSLTLNNNEFIANNATSGSIIGSDAGVLNITNSIFKENTANTIINKNNGAMNVEEVTFDDNTVTGDYRVTGSKTDFSYDDSLKTSEINIADPTDSSKLPTTLTLSYPSTTIYGGKDLRINIDLTGIDRLYRKVITINITNYGVFDVVLNNSDNTIIVRGLTVGLHNIVASYAGDIEYNPSTYKSTITVYNKQDTALSFSELNDLIKNNNGVINLENNYRYDPCYDTQYINGFVIDKDTIINGNGHFIDAFQYARLFDVSASKFEIKDLTIMNAVSSDNGAAFNFKNNVDSVNIINSKFLDNTANNGGAIYFNGVANNVNIKNSEFNNNIAGYGGAIDFNNNVTNLTIEDATIFYKNKGTYSAGAIYINGNVKNLTVDSSNFTENTASEFHGGAIYITGTSEHVNITDNIFYKNTASENGGAICANGQATYWKINSIFDTNYALRDTTAEQSSTSVRGGGAIRFATLINSTIEGTFYKNDARQTGPHNRWAARGGAISIDSSALNITINGNFTSNNIYRTTGGYNFGQSGGGAIYVNQFKNSSIDGTFVSNYATSGPGQSALGGSIWIVTLTNSNISGVYDGNNVNFARNYGANTGGTPTGGAIYINTATNANITGNFTNNAANTIPSATTANGGAVGIGTANNIKVEGNFSGNTAHDNGGALTISTSTGTVIGNSSFANNTAPSGGAVNINTGKTTVKDSTFENNSAINGAAIKSGTGASLNVTNNTFNKNNATDGSIVDSSNTELTVNNNTFTNNAGTGIVNAGAGTTAKIDNTTMKGNTVTESTVTANENSNVVDGEGNTGVETPKYNSELSVTTIGSYVNDTLTITINSNTGQVNLTIPELNINQIIDVKGSITLTYPNMKEGTYNITVSNNNETYTAKSVNTIVPITQLTFADLQTLIDNAGSNTVIDLYNDYVYVPGYKWGTKNTAVVISGDNIILDGHGYTLDGKNKTRILEITGSNVVVRNLNLINGYATTGSAILWSGDNGTVENNTINNNVAETGGGIFSTGDDLAVVNSTFTNNTAVNGGAIGSNSNNISVTNSEFADNNAETGKDLVIDDNGSITAVDNANGQTITQVVSISPDYIIVKDDEISITISNLTPNHSFKVRIPGALEETTFTANATGEVRFTLNNIPVGDYSIQYTDKSIYMIIGNFTVHPHNFRSLKNLIDNAIANNKTTIFLEDNYIYIDDEVVNIVIPRGINIISNDGVVIDANNRGPIFKFSSDIADMTIRNIVFKNAKDTNGGALNFAGKVNNLNIEDCVFTSNIATSQGGAIYANSNVDCLIIKNSNFTKNNAVTGGAIYVKGTLSNSNIKACFANNTAKNGGGAIWFDSTADHLTLNSTFFNNSEDSH